MMRKYCWVLALLLTVRGAQAQVSRAETDAYIARLRAFFDGGRALSYHYQLVMAGTQDKSSRTLQGIIQVSGQSLYDSCEAYIQLKNKDYLLQINRESRAVSLVSFSRYRSLIGLDPGEGSDGLAVQIPTEALDSAVSLHLSGAKGQEVAEFRFKKQLHGFSYIRFRMAGSQVKEVEMNMSATGDDGQKVLYTLRMYQIRQSVNEALFNHNRFYRISGGKVIYGAAYRNFQHYEVI